MGYAANFVLGVSFVVVGLFATVLQLWLWTFPMVPDPSGVDPNGVTTAPRFWRMAHRGLGYLFIAIYLVLVSQMVPRLWRYEEEAWNGFAVAHTLLGVLVGVVLAFKVLVLRRIQRIGKSLRPLGLAVFALSVLTVAVVARPAFVLRMPDDPELLGARKAVFENCRTCHGLSKVISEDGDREDWLDVLEEMEENADERGLADPSAGRREEIATYLSIVLSDEDDRD